MLDQCTAENALQRKIITLQNDQLSDANVRSSEDTVKSKRLSKDTYGPDKLVEQNMYHERLRELSAQTDEIEDDLERYARLCDELQSQVSAAIM